MADEYDAPEANSCEMIDNFFQRVDTHRTKCLDLEKEVAIIQMQLDAFNVSRASDPQNDVVEVTRASVALRLSTKGFSVMWLLNFWRKYGVRPQPFTSTQGVFQPASGEWLGKITCGSSTNFVVREIVIPESAPKQCCYMDLVPGTAQKPNKLVSHWWGATFYGDLLCIIQDATSLAGEALEWFVSYGIDQAGQASRDALQQTYWMCIFAVNQHVSICGMCNDCNVVSKGNTCDVCHIDLYNPCTCGSPKYQTGHVLCEMDKFDEVMTHMQGGLCVAFDSEICTLERVWVVSEIGKSLETGKNITWQMPNEIADRFCQEHDAALVSVQNCRASLPADRDMILQQIRMSVGIQAFDTHVAEAVQPILRDFALEKVVKSQRGTPEVEAILRRRANVDHTIELGRTVLTKAAWDGSLGIVQILLNYKATVDAQDLTGGTPLFMSAQKGFVDVLKHLIAAKADVDKPVNDGSTPICMASQEGHADVVLQLIKSRADVDKPTNEGVTPLIMSIQMGRVEVVQLLISAEADVDRSKPDGASPTFIGAQKGHAAVIQVLLATKADCNKPMSIASCHSPLTIAAYMGHSEVCRLLLSAGAASAYQALPKEEEPFLTRGGVAADIAKEQGHAAVIQCLQDNV